MANIKSAKKRIRQNKKRYIRNSIMKSSVRTASKKVIKMVESKDTKEPQALQDLFKKFTKTIDTASRKGVVHWKTAARKKSRLAKKINSIINQ